MELELNRDAGYFLTQSANSDNRTPQGVCVWVGIGGGLGNSASVFNFHARWDMFSSDMFYIPIL